MEELRSKQLSSIHKHNTRFIKAYFENVFNTVLPTDLSDDHASDVYDLVQDVLQDDTPLIEAVEDVLNRIFTPYKK